jgi:hypothetical protein
MNCDHDEKLLGDNADTTQKNNETVIDASSDIGLEVNVEKTKYLLMSRHQNGRKNHNVKIVDRSSDISPPTSAEVNNTWIYTSTPPYVFMAYCLIS